MIKLVEERREGLRAIRRRKRTHIDNCCSHCPFALPPFPPASNSWP